MDDMLGGSTAAKEAELADLQERAQSAPAASQLSTLADAVTEEAAKAESKAEAK